MVDGWDKEKPTEKEEMALWDVERGGAPERLWEQENVS